MSEEVKTQDHQGEREVRIAKVHKMKAMGVVPYAQSFSKTHNIGDIITSYEEKIFRDIEVIIPAPELQVTTAGRMTLFRSHGKLSFARILDGTQQIQIMFHRDNCKIDISQGTEEKKLVDTLTHEGEEMSAYKFLEKMVDV